MTEQPQREAAAAIRKAMEPIVALARLALRDLDQDDVPHRLERVAGATGKRLAPPLVTALLAEIDSNEWFREQVAKHLTEDASPLTRAFVERPDGWWHAVAAAVAERGISAQARALLESEAERDRLAAELATAKQRAVERETRRDATADRLGVELRAARSRLKDLQRAREAGEAEIRDELAALRREVGEAQAARAAAERSLEEMRERWRRRRQQRGRGAAEPASRGSLPSDPVAMARAIDLQMAQLAQLGAEARAPDRAHPRLRLPPGMSPDSVEALWWLAGAAPPVQFVVDGYNVVFHIDQDRRRAAQARERLNDGLRRLRRQSSSRPAITVVYDSALRGDRRSRNMVDGIEVRFAPEGDSADDEVIRLAREGDRVVVISSDREVQDGAVDAGALVIWAEALAQLVRS